MNSINCADGLDARSQTGLGFDENFWDENREITRDSEARRESLVLTLRLIYKFSLTAEKERRARVEGLKRER